MDKDKYIARLEKNINDHKAFIDGQSDKIAGLEDNIRMRAETVERLQAELEKHQWVSVEDGPPKAEGWYLTKYRGDGRQQLSDKAWVRTYPYGGIFSTNWNPKKKGKYSVTHWKPIHLPHPKKGKNK
jgi:hypothetical protein